MKSTKLFTRIAGAALVTTLVSGGALFAQPAGAAVGPTTVTVSSTANPSVAGQAVTLKAKIVDPTIPVASIAGSVAFLDGATTIGTTTTIRSGTVTFATRALSAGSHDITASFTSTGGSTTTSAPIVQTVNVASTTITLTSSNPNAHYGDAGRIAAVVKAIAPGAGIPTGSVDFSVDGGYFWTAALDAQGTATLALTDLYPSYSAGTYQITATYSGDANYNPSTTAGPLAQTLIGISTEPITTITLNANGLPVFTPRSFTMSSWNPVGCNVTIVNNTPYALALAYGTPGSWKRLPFGGIAAGASKGVGVGMANYTGYFTTTANLNNYVAIHCV